MIKKFLSFFTQLAAFIFNKSFFRILIIKDGCYNFI